MPVANGVAVSPSFGGSALGGGVVPPGGDNFLFLSAPGDSFLFLDGGDFELLS